MRKLSYHETIAVAVALVVVGFLLFGASFWSMFKGSSLTTNQATSMNGENYPATGVKIEDVVVGTGATPKAGDSVTVNYTGMLIDGKVFDTSYGRKPYEFTYGVTPVIKGWTKGLEGMKVGGKRRLIIAPDYGYGSQNVGPIPANSVLIFDVELLDVASGAAR